MRHTNFALLSNFERELVEFVRKKKGLSERHIRYVRFVTHTPYAGVLPSL